MKRISIVLLLLTMLFTICACGQTNETAPNSTPTKPVVEESVSTEKTEANTDPASNAIVGKWTAIAGQEFNATTMKAGKQFVIEDLNYLVLTAKADGTATVSFDGTETKTTWEFDYQSSDGTIYFNVKDVLETRFFIEHYNTEKETGASSVNSTAYIFVRGDISDVWVG